MPAADQASVSSPPAEASAQFSPDRSAPGHARHFVGDALRRWGHPPALVAVAELLVSELATNAVVHARSPFSLELHRHARGVRLTVADSSRIRPILRDDDPLAPAGRGLRLVDMLAADWGVEVTAGGKTIWADLEG
jgi:anti-sigma regulatory factor (Ser/Thr protein kinase)